MSHQNSTFIPWPSFPALIGEEAYECGGSPSDPVSLDAWQQRIRTQFPNGLPVPSDWAGAEAYFSWGVTGVLYLVVSLTRQQRGENLEEPDVSRGKRVAFSVDDCAEARVALLLENARAWRSGWTPDEQKMHSHLDAMRKKIRGWIDQPDARTIPFFAAGGRVNIAQAAEAVAFELYFRPTAPLPVHIERARQEIAEAVAQYPVAAPGLRVLCAELGVPLS